MTSPAVTHLHLLQAQEADKPAMAVQQHPEYSSMKFSLASLAVQPFKEAKQGLQERWWCLAPVGVCSS
jgi:hypothetical protein